MDMVIAAISLPNYSRNPREAINSILEMIRVARNRVVFARGWDESSNSEGVVELGIGGLGGKKFSFRLRDLLTKLESFGISWKLHKGKNSLGVIEIVNVDLDVSGKDSRALRSQRSEFLATADNFKV